MWTMYKEIWHLKAVSNENKTLLFRKLMKKNYNKSCNIKEQQLVTHYSKQR